MARTRTKEPAKRTGRGAADKDRFTPEKRRAFLDRYAKGCTVATACRSVGISAVTIFKTIRKDAEFAKAYEEVQQLNTDELEDLMNTLARAGNIAALFGTLKARRPERWGSHSKVDLTNSDGSFKAFVVGAAKATQEFTKNVSAEEATQH